MSRLIAAVGIGICALAVTGGTARGDDGWNPFKVQEQRRAAERGNRAKAQEPDPSLRAEPLAPMDGIQRRTPADTAATGLPGSAGGQAELGGPAGSPPVVGTAAAEAVQRGELTQPVMASDGSGLPHGFWGGLDAVRAQDMIATLHIPPRSRALHELWRRLWNSGSIEGPGAVRGDTGSKATVSYPAIRIEALYRSGLVSDLGQALKELEAEKTDPVLGVLAARTRIALGQSEAGCAGIKPLQRVQPLPEPIKSELLVLGAWCAATARDAATAGLAADLLRAEGVDAPIALAVLDALSAGSNAPFVLDAGKRPTLIDYRFLELVQSEANIAMGPSAEPALLASVALTGRNIKTRVQAAEAALVQHATTPAELATVYRAVPQSAVVQGEPAGERQEPALRRALLFKAIEGERTPIKKARLMRTLLDESRRTGHYMQTAAMLSTAVSDMVAAAEIGWFAETAVEINLAAGRYDAARGWAEPLSPAERYGGLRYWLVLIDIADTAWRGRRGESLGEAEQFAVRGRLSADLMHRLVTVLDALDYQIPIPLWEAASRSQQPSGGHLPETGVLSQLQEAAKKKEHGATVLLAMRTLGPDSADGAHVIALGDTIRALRRAGFEADARRLGLEALFSGWPRQASN